VVNTSYCPRPLAPAKQNSTWILIMKQQK
jgi:hypothetical protein